MRSSLSISNFSHRFRRVFSILLLIITIVYIFSKYCNIVQYPRNNFYEFYNYIKKDRIDVLCVGSSHVYCGINPVQMYDDYGIAAFDLANGSQAVWNSYYYIREAVKTQNPKIVILDVYTLANEDTSFDSKIQSNLLNMPLSLNKWNALKAAGANNKEQIFLRFPITHSRYSVLERKDFNLNDKMNGYFLGYNYQTRIVPYDEKQLVDVRGIKDNIPITKKAEEYLRKCIEFCLDKKIDMVLTNTPWPDITKEKQKKYNYIQGIADEYGIPFLNGCLYNDEIGLDYMVDSMGDGGHLNHTGVTKYTKWLSEYLVDTYDLPDRRGDSRYEAWNRQSDKLEAVMRKERIAQTEDIQKILDELWIGNDLYYVISLNGKYEKMSGGGIKC